MTLINIDRSSDMLRLMKEHMKELQWDWRRLTAVVIKVWKFGKFGDEKRRGEEKRRFGDLK